MACRNWGPVTVPTSSNRPVIFRDASSDLPNSRSKRMYNSSPVTAQHSNRGARHSRARIQSMPLLHCSPYQCSASSGQSLAAPVAVAVAVAVGEAAVAAGQGLVHPWVGETRRQQAAAIFCQGVLGPAGAWQSGRASIATAWEGPGLAAGNAYIGRRYAWSSMPRCLGGRSHHGGWHGACTVMEGRPRCMSANNNTEGR